MRVPLVARIVCLALFILSPFSARSGELTGPFANRLSPSDVQQIKALVRNDRSVPHTVKKIEAVRPDKVAIQTTGLDSATYYDFTVSKRSGKWVLDESSIEITTGAANNRRNDSDVIGH